jgi:cytochrome c oxidase subunit 2
VQKFWSILFGATMAGALLLFIVAPFTGGWLPPNGWWLPRNVATFGPGIDNLFYLILAITGIFFVLTEAILVYNLYRFAGQPGRKSIYQHGNHTLELAWTFVPGVILLVLAIVQIQVWAEVKFQKNMPRPDGTTQQIEVVARQWEWRLRYPSRARMTEWEQDPSKAGDFAANPHLDDVLMPNDLHIWKGTQDKPNRVLVHLRTLDVIHSFFLPHLRLKQDALPGKTIPVWFAVTDHNVEYDAKSGRWVEIGGLDSVGKAKDPEKVWELACAEFCGVRHSMMRGKLFVHKDKEDYLKWLQKAEADQNAYQPVTQTPVVSR